MGGDVFSRRMKVLGVGFMEVSWDGDLSDEALKDWKKRRMEVRC